MKVRGWYLSRVGDNLRLYSSSLLVFLVIVELSMSKYKVIRVNSKCIGENRKLNVFNSNMLFLMEEGEICQNFHIIRVQICYEFFITVSGQAGSQFHRVLSVFV